MPRAGRGRSEAGPASSAPVARRGGRSEAGERGPRAV